VPFRHIRITCPAKESQQYFDLVLFVTSGPGQVQGLLNDVFLRYHADTAALDGLHRMYSDLHSEGMLPRTAGLLHSGPATKYVTEGKVVVNGGKRRTQSTLLRDKARDHFRQSGGGKPSCCICGACFDHLIGSGCVGTKIIRIHHLKPISESDAVQATCPAQASPLLPSPSSCQSLPYGQRIRIGSGQDSPGSRGFLACNARERGR